MHTSILRILFQQYILFPLIPFPHHFQQTIPVGIKAKAFTWASALGISQLDKIQWSSYYGLSCDVAHPDLFSSFWYSQKVRILYPWVLYPPSTLTEVLCSLQNERGGAKDGITILWLLENSEKVKLALTDLLVVLSLWQSPQWKFFPWKDLRIWCAIFELPKKTDFPIQKTYIAIT